MNFHLDGWISIIDIIKCNQIESCANTINHSIECSGKATVYYTLLYMTFIINLWLHSNNCFVKPILAYFSQFSYSLYLIFSIFTIRISTNINRADSLT